MFSQPLSFPLLEMRTYLSLLLMSSYLAYTEMIAEIESPLNGVSAKRLVGEGTLVSLSAYMFDTPSPKTVAHCAIGFVSGSNPSGNPAGIILCGPISTLSGIRWDGRSLMLPDMEIFILANCILPAKISLSILVEHEKRT